MDYRSQRGFFLMLLSLIVIILVVTGSIGYYLWHKQAHSVSEVGTYDQCVNAVGSKQLETYPAICVTQDGKQLVQPNPPSKSDAALTIREWSVEIPLNSTINDAYYRYDSISGYVFFSTHTLDGLISKIQCPAGLHGLTMRRTQSANLATGGGLDVHVGDYEYLEVQVPQMECAVRSNQVQSDIVKQINILMTDIQAAAAGMQQSK